MVSLVNSSIQNKSKKGFIIDLEIIFFARALSTENQKTKGEVGVSSTDFEGGVVSASTQRLSKCFGL